MCPAPLGGHCGIPHPPETPTIEACRKAGVKGRRRKAKKLSAARQRQIASAAAPLPRLVLRPANHESG